MTPEDAFTADHASLWQAVLWLLCLLLVALVVLYFTVARKNRNRRP